MVSYPRVIRVDQDSEFVSRDLGLWAYQKGDQALQAQIKEARESHAQMLRELREDREQAQNIAREAELGEAFNAPARTTAKLPPTPEQRLERALAPACAARTTRKTPRRRANAGQWPGQVSRARAVT